MGLAERDSQETWRRRRMSKPSAAWVVRPYPHGIYRWSEFKQHGMAALGWPDLGDLSGCSRDGIRDLLARHYYQNASPQALGQATGIVDRFVNQIGPGDAVLVPDGSQIHVGLAADSYSFHPDKSGDGYPHWIGVHYEFAALRIRLKAPLHNGLKGRQSVYSIHAGLVADLRENKGEYVGEPPLVDPAEESKYRRRLAEGTVSGINPDSFEDIVRIVLSKALPSLERLPKTNAPPGADTDLLASLPGDIAIRVQVKCYQDKHGHLGRSEVRQLRNSMDRGDHGIVVTSGSIGDDARVEARSDRERPISLVSGHEFTGLILEYMREFTPKELGTLGFRMVVR